MPIGIYKNGGRVGAVKKKIKKKIKIRKKRRVKPQKTNSRYA